MEENEEENRISSIVADILGNAEIFEFQRARN